MTFGSPLVLSVSRWMTMKMCCTPCFSKLLVFVFVNFFAVLGLVFFYTLYKGFTRTEQHMQADYRIVTYNQRQKLKDGDYVWSYIGCEKSCIVCKEVRVFFVSAFVSMCDNGCFFLFWAINISIIIQKPMHEKVGIRPTYRLLHNLKVETKTMVC